MEPRVIQGGKVMMTRREDGKKAGIIVTKQQMVAYMYIIHVSLFLTFQIVK